MTPKVAGQCSVRCILGSFLVLEIRFNWIYAFNKMAYICSKV